MVCILLEGFGNDMKAKVVGRVKEYTNCNYECIFTNNDELWNVGGWYSIGTHWKSVKRLSAKESFLYEV